MKPSLVHQDERGLFIIMNGQRYRSGPLDYALRPGLRCDDGGLTVGTRVKTRMISSTPVAILESADGGENTHWEVESSKDALATKQAYAAANPAIVADSRRKLDEIMKPIDVIRASIPA